MNGGSIRLHLTAGLGGGKCSTECRFPLIDVGYLYVFLKKGSLYYTITEEDLWSND